MGMLDKRMRVFATRQGPVVIMMARPESVEGDIIGDAQWTMRSGSSFFGLAFDQIAARAPCIVEVSEDGVASFAELSRREL